MALHVSSSDLTCDEYVAEVLAMPRDEVTAVYSELYREVDSDKWEFENGNNEKGLPHEDYKMSDENVQRFAEQDYYDGPDAWAFLSDDSAERAWEAYYMDNPPWSKITVDND